MVLLCGSVLPEMPKMLAKRKRPVREIRACAGEVSTGKVTVESAIGVSEPSLLMKKPV